MNVNSKAFDQNSRGNDSRGKWTYLQGLLHVDGTLPHMQFCSVSQSESSNEYSVHPALTGKIDRIILDTQVVNSFGIIGSVTLLDCQPTPNVMT